MMFRRRKSHAADVEAFHRGAASVGGYNRTAEIRAANKLFDETYKGLFGEYPADHSPASSAVGEHRAPPSTVSIGVDGGAPSTSIAETCARVDSLYRDNARLRSELNQALAQRDIARNQRDEYKAQLAEGAAP